MYNILVREWNPSTWEFGTLHEIAIDKMLSIEKLGELLQSSLFPHIGVKQLFATRVNICKPFIRSDLVLRSWQALAFSKQWIGTMPFEINRDSVFIVVKNHSIPVKQLALGEDDEMIAKWASHQYMAHVISKQEHQIPVSGTIKHDPLLQASLANTYHFDGPAPRKETGIKIRVGQGYADKKKEDEADEGEIDIAPLF